MADWIVKNEPMHPMAWHVKTRADLAEKRGKEIEDCPYVGAWLEFTMVSGERWDGVADYREGLGLIRVCTHWKERDPEDGSLIRRWADEPTYLNPEHVTSVRAVDQEEAA